MTRAYVLLNVELESGKEVLDSLKEIPEVKEAHQLYGVYDLIIRVEGETRQEIKFLIERIKDIGKLRSTLCLICIESSEVQVGERGKKGPL